MRKLLISAVIIIAVTGLAVSGCGKEKAAPEPGPAHKGLKLSGEEMNEMNTETIVLGGGCFWCTEAVFSMVDGITDTTVGYAGGSTESPKYEDVCGGATGHAEVVRVTYDPSRVTLEKLLDLFFASHDPTSLNRQGADIGTQYRSTILCTSEEQKAAVEAFIENAQVGQKGKIVTEVENLDAFYPAEDYHQDYYEKNPNAPYCSSVISPKVKKVKDLL